MAGKRPRSRTKHPVLRKNPPRRVQASHVYRDQSSTRWFMQHVRHVLGTADLRSPEQDRTSLPHRPRDLRKLKVGGGGGMSLADALEATHTDAFLVLHNGAVVYETYLGEMTPETPHMWQSVSKSLISCLAGSLITNGRLDPNAPLRTQVPELANSAYGDATVRHLLDMQVGIEYSEDYDDPDSDVNELDRIYGLRPPREPNHPGSTYDYATTTSKRGTHGDRFDYVSLNINVLAWVLERTTGVWLPDLLRREIWGKLGGEHDAYISLDGAGNVQAESGICTSLRDLARLGLALSHGGVLNDRQVVPAAWIDEIIGGGDRETFASHEEARIIPGGSYKDNFWVARSGAGSAFMGLGIYGQILYVNPATDLVVAKFSTQPQANNLDFLAIEFSLCEQLMEL